MFGWDLLGECLATKDAGAGTGIWMLPDIILDLCSPCGISTLKDLLCRLHSCGCLVVKVRSVYVQGRRLHSFTSAFPPPGFRDTWGFSAVLRPVPPHTRYPSLESSGVTAALRTLSLGLRPPPRLEAECTVRKSRLDGGLEGRTPDGADALEAKVWPLGSTTVLMTENKEGMSRFKSLCLITGHVHRTHLQVVFELVWVRPRWTRFPEMHMIDR